MTTDNKIMIGAAIGVGLFAAYYISIGLILRKLQ